MITKAGFLLVLTLMLPWVAKAACVVESKATVPLQIVAGRITLPVEVNGTTATFVLDTGATRSLVTAEAAQRLGLARDQWVGTTMSGVGGIERRPNADPRSLSLGGVPLARRTLTRDRSLTVGDLPGLQGTGIDGLLGRDFLAVFDLDLDFPDRRLTLYRVNDCTGRFVPWSGHEVAIPFAVPAVDSVILSVAVDGHPLRALLDTGASASLITASGMFKLGLDQTRLSADLTNQATGMGPRTVTVHRHRFKTLTIDNQTTGNPELWVEPVRLSPIVDMLLGADWLATRHLWISFATRQVFLAE